VHETLLVRERLAVGSRHAGHEEGLKVCALRSAELAHFRASSFLRSLRASPQLGSSAGRHN
jgi:hypothetical protein